MSERTSTVAIISDLGTRDPAIAQFKAAVLAVNPCGSTGYGEAFANALHDRFPGPDNDDLMAVVDTVAARPDSHPRRSSSVCGPVANVAAPPAMASS